MDELDYQQKFVEAFRLDRFRLELHTVTMPTEDDDFEIHVIDLCDPELPMLRLSAGECGRIACGLRLLGTIMDVDRGHSRPEALIQHLRPIVENTFAGSYFDKAMQTLDRERRRGDPDIAREDDDRRDEEAQ